MIRFTVYGSAEPAGSKRAFVVNGHAVVSDANRKSRGWKTQVSATARDAYRGALLDGPIAVTMRFYRPRPAGHMGKKGVRASAPGHPATRPDVLKLARAVEDALTGVVWRDDAQIVDERLFKRYGEPARVEVEIESLEPGFPRTQDGLPI